MKKCLRLKCQKEFEPNKPKQVFCSAKCRVYFSRENKVPVVPIKKLPKYVSNLPSKPLEDLSSSHLIAKYQEELTFLNPSTPLGKKRIEWINKKISELNHSKTT